MLLLENSIRTNDFSDTINESHIYHLDKWMRSQTGGIFVNLISCILNLGYWNQEYADWHNTKDVEQDYTILKFWDDIGFRKFINNIIKTFDFKKLSFQLILKKHGVGRPLYSTYSHHYQFRGPYNEYYLNGL